MKVKRETTNSDKPNLRITLKRKKLLARNYLDKFAAQQSARLATLRQIGRPRGTLLLTSEEPVAKPIRMDSFKRPDALDLSGNMAEHWKKFKQQLEYFMIAIGYDAKPEKVKIATLLNLIGDDAVEVYNTFVFDGEENNLKKEDVVYVKEASTVHLDVI